MTDAHDDLQNPVPAEALAVVRTWLEDNGLEYDEKTPGQLSFSLPGEKKLQTPVRLDLGPHALGIHAFVCRNPDENHVGVYRWLLEKNLRLFAVAFAVDKDGDIYLDARLPLSAVTADDLDNILGTVLSVADNSFNTILELGFASSIRKEWEWRLSHGEPTANLAAFEHLRPTEA
ncbi:YbjN domain-containing protein [Nocardioides jiangxiensis]|uniref:YbjN domain-containing protein n=1 Tax=Nocardioides jiangxiensis TaxID=3064524 RepID=A0ABT9B2F1_9ACTN|nr:YbjN domain-containing protein [Nocardioides sp. WY-20]MDO7867797.1 YbjN domain-containing protein [Nocardioides sp. WY-20]